MFDERDIDEGTGDARPANAGDGTSDFGGAEVTEGVAGTGEGTRKDRGNDTT